MSIKHQEEITCPQCGTRQYMQIWSVLASHDERGMELLEHGYLNVFGCDKCSYRSFIDQPVLYDDLEHRYCVQYVSRIAAQIEEFYSNIGTNGQMVLDERNRAEPEKYQYLFHPHYVFSLREIPPYIFFRKQCAKHGLDPATTYPILEPPPFIGSGNRLLRPGTKPFVSPQLQAAKQVLGEERLINFFRKVKRWDGEDVPTDICDALDAGHQLDDIFGWFEQPRNANSSSPENEARHIKLQVERMAERIFSISFGFVDTPDEEVAEWLVAYDENGAVLQWGPTKRDD